jgi:S1-C subfamily serine protease
VPDSPAERAGIRPDDLVVMIDSQVAASVRETSRLVGRLEQDASLRIAVLRGEQLMEFALQAKNDGGGEDSK